MKKILLGLITITFVFGAEYIVPPEFDNTVMATESEIKVLISNTLPTLSTTKRVIGGKNVRYRCLAVPKIDCRATVPRVVLTASEVSLRDTSTNKLVNIYAYDVFEEELGTDWMVCGGAVGGTTWDDSTLKSSKDSSGNIVITHTYIENKHQSIYHFFTDSADAGASTSFMVIDVKQVCI